jgi:hypothetical protein
MNTKKEKTEKCPMCKESCGNGYIWMLHHTIGCSMAKKIYGNYQKERK